MSFTSSANNRFCPSRLLYVTCNYVIEAVGSNLILANFSFAISKPIAKLTNLNHRKISVYTVCY